MYTASLQKNRERIKTGLTVIEPVKPLGPAYVFIHQKSYVGNGPSTFKESSRYNVSLGCLDTSKLAKELWILK